MDETIRIVDDICSNYNLTNTVFLRRKCLTYLDEFEQKLDDTKKVVSLVSFTSLMDHYINNIEKNWLENIRNEYGFEKGTPIHFTKLRKIAQLVKYHKNGQEFISEGWNDEYVIFKANRLIDLERGEFKSNVKSGVRREFVEEYRIWKLFRNDSDGKIDVIKLQQFYENIIKVIKQAEFNILCTSVVYDTKSLHKVRFMAEQIKSPHVIAFSEHLDLLCFYLKHGFISEDELRESAELYAEGFSTKLRWDGDDGFNQRHDYRLLFNKVVSMGTTQYQSNTVRKCLDEIRFVNKHEIGYYDDIQKQSLVSHIGCDIADFIAYYVGKYSIKNEIIKMKMNQGKTEEQAEMEFIESVTFKIGNKNFNPYEETLKDKIIINDKYTSIQVIKECHYNKL